MSGGLDGPAPHERARPAGRRDTAGARPGATPTGAGDRRAVLSALVRDESGVLAEVTALFARRRVNIERLVAEPTDDGEHSRITFVVEPPHPGVERVTTRLEGLLPVVRVDELDRDAACHLSASVEGGA